MRDKTQDRTRSVIKETKEGKKLRYAEVHIIGGPMALRDAQKVENAVASLPPPGYAREELKRARQATLDEMSDEAARLMEGGTFEFKMQREAQALLNGGGPGVKITHRQPDRDYAWVTYTHPSNNPGAQVELMQATGGWRVVKGKDQECGHLPRTAEGYRRAVDCVLMWRPRALSAALAKEIAIREARANGDEYQSEDESVINVTGPGVKGAADAKLAAFMAENGLVKTSKMDPEDPAFKTMMNRMHARNIAKQRFTQKLRSGTIPGMEVGE